MLFRSERVAAFLSRCLFSMFAEDVGLLPKIDNDGAFTSLLKSFLLSSPPGRGAGGEGGAHSNPDHHNPRAYPSKTAADQQVRT